MYFYCVCSPAKFKFITNSVSVNGIFFFGLEKGFMQINVYVCALHMVGLDLSFVYLYKSFIQKNLHSHSCCIATEYDELCVCANLIFHSNVLFGIQVRNFCWQFQA